MTNECVMGAEAPEEALARKGVWEAGQTQRNGLKQIKALETLITLRRLREAAPDDAGGNAAGRAWLADIDRQIASARALLS